MYQSVLNSDKKLQQKTDLTAVRARLTVIDSIIAHAKSAAETVKNEK
jgi:hypothetical protein